MDSGGNQHNQTLKDKLLKAEYQVNLPDFSILDLLRVKSTLGIMDRMGVWAITKSKLMKIAPMINNMIRDYNSDKKTIFDLQLLGISLIENTERYTTTIPKSCHGILGELAFSSEANMENITIFELRKK